MGVLISDLTSPTLFLSSVVVGELLLDRVVNCSKHLGSKKRKPDNYFNKKLCLKKWFMKIPDLIGKLFKESSSVLSSTLRSQETGMNPVAVLKNIRSWVRAVKSPSSWIKCGKSKKNMFFWGDLQQDSVSRTSRV